MYAGVVKPFLSDLLREPVIVYEGSKRSGVINYLILEVPIPLKLSAVVVNNHHPLLTETKGLVRRLRCRSS